MCRNKWGQTDIYPFQYNTRE